MRRRGSTGMGLRSLTVLALLLRVLISYGICTEVCSLLCFYFSLFLFFIDFDKVESYLRQYMVEDWESISVMGEYVRGMDELIRLVNITLLAFPDIELHIVDTFCEGNDIDGYKTTMPVIHTATHLGYHPVFGSPTGKTLTWYGVPNCFIKNFDGQWK